MQTYDRLFELRGSRYDQAMRRYPNARDQEFRQVLERATLKDGAIVADVPAGGGYLRAYLPPTSIWWGHEPCVSFTNHGKGKTGNKPLLPLPWPDNSVDVAISLAGVHHIENKQPLFVELNRVVKPGGQLVLSDVASGTPVARFLDDFVGVHNSTGHEGVYLDDRTLIELSGARWQVRSQEMVDFHWVFASYRAMADFCQTLFDICKADSQKIIREIETILGIDELSDGSIGMRWSLMTIVAEK